MSSREEEDAQKGELGRNEFRTGDTVILHVWNTRYKLLPTNNTEWSKSRTDVIHPGT